jgi:hypothetical protein
MEGVMKTRTLVFTAALLSLCAESAEAWNTAPMSINALEFFKTGLADANINGRIKFTLFESGTRGPEFRCGDTGFFGVWFFIERCAPADSACQANVQRMGSMLLAAKLAGKRVRVQRAGRPPGCEIEAVALVEE